MPSRQTEEECIPPVTRRWLARLFTFDTVVVIIVVIFSAGVLWNGFNQAIADAQEDSSAALQASVSATTVAQEAKAVAERNSMKLSTIEYNQIKASDLAEKRFDQNNQDMRVIQNDIKKILSAVGGRHNGD